MLVQLLQIGCVLHTFLRVVTVAVGAGTCIIVVVVVVAVEGSGGGVLRLLVICPHGLLRTQLDRRCIRHTNKNTFNQDMDS